MIWQENSGGARETKIEGKTPYYIFESCNISMVVSTFCNTRRFSCAFASPIFVSCWPSFSHTAIHWSLLISDSPDIPEFSFANASYCCSTNFISLTNHQTAMHFLRGITIRVWLWRLQVTSSHLHMQVSDLHNFSSQGAPNKLTIFLIHSYTALRSKKSRGIDHTRHNIGHRRSAQQSHVHLEFILCFEGGIIIQPFRSASELLTFRICRAWLTPSFP